MKKFVSILLAVVLVASAVVTASAYTIWPVDDGLDPDGIISVEAKTAAEVLAAYEAETGETVATRRYFFQMPNGENGMRGAEGNLAPTWYNAYTKGAGVYWWGKNPGACDAWAGYQAAVEDADQSIYYVDMPTTVKTFVWNNGIDGTMDPDYPLYKLAAQTSDVASQYPDGPDEDGIPEYDTIPEGRPREIGFDHCIFIVDPDQVDINPLSEKQTCGGTWYIYYENGCYGLYDTTSAHFTSVEDNCVNPDHYENGDITGKHIGHASFIAGDADGDGQVTVMDATRIQRFIAELCTEDDLDMKAANVDGDEVVTIMDATRIQRYKAELCNLDGSTPYVAEA